MSSAIYSNGNHAAAIAATKAAAAGFFIAGTDGVKRLDTTGLLAWLNDQCSQVPSDTGVVNADACNTALAFTDKNGPVNAMNAALQPGAFAALPSWPANPGSNIAFSPVVAAQKGLAALRTLTNAITAAWDGFPAELDTAVSGYFDGNISPAITPAVQPITETRSYVATWVNDWGEESGASPVSDLVTVDQNDTVTVAQPPVPAGRNLTKWRIYRGQTSNSGGEFLLAVELDIGVNSWVDDLSGAALAEPCLTLQWDEPPANLDGVIALPNGGGAGFIDGNTLCFCEPYIYYAWPIPYRMTVAYPIVGLGVVSQTLIACTLGVPYAITGPDTTSMTAQPLGDNQPCLSRRSIVSMGVGVVYAGPDGLCVATPQAVSVITGDAGFGLFTREEWQALNPSGIVAAASEGNYVFRTADTIYQLNVSTGKLVTFDTSAFPSAFFADPATDTLFDAEGTAIKGLFRDYTSRRTGHWRSKILVQSAQAGIGWQKVEQDNGNAATLMVLGDGATMSTKTLTGLTPKRMPPGRPEEIEIDLTGTTSVTAVLLAGSLEELKSA